ncbi:MAG TPA: hypothetical protein DEQ64_03685 [Lachnoclostridium sp.]|jgi:hypothetical protein|uniref:hypothetical protein n=1 Tax=Lacrimispora sp. TaxID=2719234 RepID=UPI000ECB19BC|nr:hypothetical protein [Lacrimispora sp.]HCD42837.1 hypothetical protein [Lachnoclostridium sp.]
MLEFLQTGKALFVLAALCGIGIITRWLTRNLYKRLIKESDNLTLTKNKSLRAFKQKTENTYQMNQGIPKVKPYLERQMYDFKYMGVTLHGWNMFSNQMTLWCFLAGGAAAFAAYWYRTDSYYIVLYGSAGIMAGLFTILVDHGAGIVEKRQQLFAALDNYLENTLIYRLDLEREDLQAISGPHMETRENIRSIYSQSTKAVAEAEPEQDKKADRRSARQRNGTLEKPLRNRSPKQSMEVFPEASGEVPERGESQAPPEPKNSRRDVDYLKRSLEQIAASRERERGGRQGEDWLKDLSPDELKLIGEILQEYLT